MLTASAPTTRRVAVYQVVLGSDVVLSTTSPVAAREEAKRRGASVRVTSRRADPPAAATQELAG